MTLFALAASQVSVEKGDRSRCENTDKSPLFQNLSMQSFSRASDADSTMGDEPADNISASTVYITPDDMMNQLPEIIYAKIHVIQVSKKH